MWIIRSFLRVIISLVGALLPLLFFSGSYSPLSAYLPPLPNFLGKESTLYSYLQGALGSSLPVEVLPYSTAGFTGVTLYAAIQRLLGSARAMTYSSPNMDGSQVLRSLQTQMPMLNMNMSSEIGKNLPEDMTKSQYLILSKYREGQRKPKDVAKALAMDKRAVEEQTLALERNGYLNDDRKLTAKGLDVLG